MKKTERENWQNEMFSLITKQKRSGLSQKDFCDQHDLTLHAFYYWLRKYKQLHRVSENGFIPVEIGPIATDSKREISIHYPNGVFITLPEAVGLPRIKALIKAI